MMIVHINFPGRNRLFKRGLWDSISIKPRIETVVGWYFFLFGFPDRIEGSNYSLRTIERRNARMREIEGQPSESRLPLGEIVPGQSLPNASAQRVHNACMITPDPAVSVKVRTSFVGKVPKVQFGFSNENDGEYELLTPQKKLLNSIETVEKVVAAELQRLKRTRSARKAEREKKIRTLMSMR